MNEVVCDEEGNLKSSLTFDDIHLYGSKYGILGGLPEGEWNLKKRYGAGNSIIAFLLIVFLKNRVRYFC